MMKKEYIKPTMTVTKLQYRSQFLTSSSRGITSAKTTGLDDDLLYDENGGDPGNAW